MRLYAIQISKMFKQLKKSAQQSKQMEQNSQQGCLSRTQKINHASIPKQLLQFLARQITVLKDVTSSCNQIHPNIVASRLHECTTLMEKKISYSLGDNPQLYHDYIQDFYQHQLNELRGELNNSKMELMGKKKQLQQIRTSYDIILRQKQTYMHGMQSSRISKSNIEQIQQNSKLKKQLDHCRMLLNQNSLLIEQQAKAIQSLSIQLKAKQKEQRLLRQKYDQKILQFDAQVNNHNYQMQALIKSLSIEHRNYQSGLKELSFTKVRVLDEKLNLEKQLETKVEEIQLLTKKILEDEIIIGKLERTTSLKQKLIQQLYQQIDCVNGSLSRIGKKQEVFQKTYVQKNEEIQKLEQRIRQSNDLNQKLEKKITHLNKKIQDLQQQIKQISRQLAEEQKKLDKMNLQNESNLRKLQISQKNQIKLSKQKQRLSQQMKLLDQRYQDLCQRSREEKQEIKKQIMTEVNQLVGLVHQKQVQLKVLGSEKQQLEKQLCRQRRGRSEVQSNFQKMNILMTEIQRKIDILQAQNSSLNEAKLLLQVQLERLGRQTEKLGNIQRKYHQLMCEKKNLVESLEQVRLKQLQIVNSQKTINEEVERKQNELSQQYSCQIKHQKQLINKKDFQIRQLESKLKILQEQLRDASKLFQSQKLKMSLKIKQLEELLKQRYDFSSRFSQHSQGAY